MTSEPTLKDIIKSGMLIRHVQPEDQTEEMGLSAVMENCWALAFVHNQTEEICIEAVRQNGMALKYVRNQTEEVCLAAVKQNGMALQFSEIQNENIVKQAIKSEPRSYDFAKFTNEIIDALVIKEYPAAIAVMKNPTRKLIEDALRVNGNIIYNLKKVDKELALIAIKQSPEIIFNDTIGSINSKPLPTKSLFSSEEIEKIKLEFIKKNKDPLNSIVEQNPPTKEDAALTLLVQDGVNLQMFNSANRNKQFKDVIQKIDGLKVAIKSNPLSLLQIKGKAKTKELYLLSIEHGGVEALSFLEDKIKIKPDEIIEALKKSIVTSDVQGKKIQKMKTLYAENKSNQQLFEIVLEESELYDKYYEDIISEDYEDYEDFINKRAAKKLKSVLIDGKATNEDVLLLYNSSSSLKLWKNESISALISKAKINKAIESNIKDSGKTVKKAKMF